MSVAAAVVNRLLQNTDLLALVGTDPETLDRYIFQDTLLMGTQYLENSQQVAVVVSHVGEWDVRSPFGVQEFPRIVVQVYADPDRDAAGDKVSTVSARDKALDVSKVLTKALHRTSQFDERWLDLRVLSSTQTRGPEIASVGDGNGLVVATSYFGLITL
jgi:hypothetical protein